MNGSIPISIPRQLPIATSNRNEQINVAFEPLAISYVESQHYIARLFERPGVVLGFDSLKSKDGRVPVTTVSNRPDKWWAGTPLDQDEKVASVVVFTRM